MLVVDHDPKLTSEVFRAFAKGWGSCLIVGSAYHTKTNAKVERANGVVSDALRAFANGRKDDWDGHLPLAVFAIDDATSTLGGDLTPPGSPVASSRRFCRWRVTCTLRAVDAGDGGDGTGAAGDGAGGMEGKLDAGRVDRVFKVGDRVLLRTNELLDAAVMAKLRPRWDGPFTVTAGPSPNAYTLALPRRMRCSPKVNVDSLKPFFERLGTAPAPGPVFDAGQEGEHEVELLPNRRLVRGVTRYLVRWRRHTSADDKRLRAEELTHCQEKVAEYNATAPRRRADPAAEPAAAPPAPAPPAPAPLLPPAGFRLAASREGLAGTALVGQAVRYHWPVDGWVRGTRPQPGYRVVAHGALRPRFCPRVGGGTLAARRGFSPAGRWVLLRRVAP